MSKQDPTEDPEVEQQDRDSRQARADGPAAGSTTEREAVAQGEGAFGKASQVGETPDHAGEGQEEAGEGQDGVSDDPEEVGN